MTKIIDIDGKVFADEASISVFNGGYYFGLGIYETILIHEAVPIFYDEHINRMQKALSFLDFNVNELFFKTLELRVKTLLKHAQIDLSLARLRIIVSPSQISFPEIEMDKFTSVLILSSSKFSLKNNYSLYITKILKNSVNQIPPYVKLTANHRNLMATQIARKNGADEALVFNDKAFLCEASYANIFLVKQGKVFTPGLENNLLDGVTRNKIFRIIRKMNVTLEEKKITVEELKTFDCAFITSSTRGVKSIKKITISKEFCEIFNIDDKELIVEYNKQFQSNNLLEELNKQYRFDIENERNMKKEFWLNV